MEPHLELRDVRKAFGHVVAVDTLSMVVSRGTICGLLGPNGAGKTTSIRMIMRISLPDRGSVLLGGEPMTDELRERIGYLPEERGLYRKMKVLEHLEFLGEVRGLERREARRRGAAWLERLGLAEVRSRRVEELSKGMQQKVQFAGAVIHEPEVVILDEPFTGLDPIATRLLKDLILEMRERGTTVLFSTHVLPQAEELCDHLCLINRGRAILQGTMEQARARFARPALLVRSQAPDAAILAVAGIEAVRAHDDQRIAELADGASVAEVIRSLAQALPLEGAEPYRASLEDIFLRAVEEDHVPAA
ncbi:MAG: ABC transporter ATP-binding protein [Acidobacteriota bacterium]